VILLDANVLVELPTADAASISAEIEYEMEKNGNHCDGLIL
jgi:hypothetical protein